MKEPATEICNRSANTMAEPSRCFNLSVFHINAIFIELLRFCSCLETKYATLLVCVMSKDTDGRSVSEKWGRRARMKEENKKRRKRGKKKVG